jgi:hypothetical protein
MVSLWKKGKEGKEKKREVIWFCNKISCLSVSHLQWGSILINENECCHRK